MIFWRCTEHAGLGMRSPSSDKNSQVDPRQGLAAREVRLREWSSETEVNSEVKERWCSWQAVLQEKSVMLRAPAP